MVLARLEMDGVDLISHQKVEVSLSPLPAEV